MSHGRWVTALVQLPAGYDPAAIDVGSIRLRGPQPDATPVGVDPAAPTVTAGDRRLVVKFDREAVEKIVQPATNKLELEAVLETGEGVLGTGRLHVIGRPGT